MPLNTSWPAAIISGIAGAASGATSNSPFPIACGLAWIACARFGGGRLGRHGSGSRRSGATPTARRRRRRSRPLQAGRRRRSSPWPPIRSRTWRTARGTSSTLPAARRQSSRAGSRTLWDSRSRRPGEARPVDLDDREAAVIGGLVEIARCRRPEERRVGAALGEGLHALVGRKHGDRRHVVAWADDVLRLRLELHGDPLALQIFDAGEVSGPWGDDRVAEIE